MAGFEALDIAERVLTVAASAWAAIGGVKRWFSNKLKFLREDFQKKIEEMEKQAKNIMQDGTDQRERLVVLETRLADIGKRQDELSTETKQQTALLNRIAGALGVHGGERSH